MTSPGFSHQDEMPKVPPPEAVQNEVELYAAAIVANPEGLKRWSSVGRPFDNRPIGESENLAAPPKRPPRRLMWFKTIGALPDAPALHRYLLAYASDSWFLTTALLPHGVTWFSSTMQVASLDHATCGFTRRFALDRSGCCTSSTVRSHAGARGFVRGSIFKRDGTLVASTAQEGLMRQRASDRFVAPATT